MNARCQAEFRHDAFSSDGKKTDSSYVTEIGLLSTVLGSDVHGLQPIDTMSPGAGLVGQPGMASSPTLTVRRILTTHNICSTISGINSLNVKGNRITYQLLESTKSHTLIGRHPIPTGSEKSAMNGALTRYSSFAANHTGSMVLQHDSWATPQG